MIRPTEMEEVRFLLDLELWCQGATNTGESRLLKLALADPTAVFDCPDQVLGHPRLTDPEKLRILRVWEHDARELAVAEQEGMAGGEEGHLRRVLVALGEMEVVSPAEGSGSGSLSGKPPAPSTR